MTKSKGWKGESQRHALASKGIKSGNLTQKKVVKKTIKNKKIINFNKIPYKAITKDSSISDIEKILEDTYDWDKLNEKLNSMEFGEFKNGNKDEDEVEFFNGFDGESPFEEDKALYIGNFQRIVPGGATAYSNGQDEEDYIISIKYQKALERVANKHGMDMDIWDEDDLWLLKRSDGSITQKYQDISENVNGD